MNSDSRTAAPTTVATTVPTRMSRSWMCAISWRDHALELDAVQRLEQALGHGDRRMLRVAARRVRVRRVLGDHVDPRLRDPGRDREALDQVVQAGLVLGRHLASRASTRGRACRRRTRTRTTGPRRSPARRRRRRVRRRTGSRPPHRSRRGTGSHDEQEHGLALVRRDLLVHQAPGSPSPTLDRTAGGRGRRSRRTRARRSAAARATRSEGNRWIAGVQTADLVVVVLAGVRDLRLGRR